MLDLTGTVQLQVVRIAKHHTLREIIPWGA